MGGAESSARQERRSEEKIEWHGTAGQVS